MREYINIIENINNTLVLPDGIDYEEAYYRVSVNPEFIKSIGNPDQTLQSLAVGRDYRSIAHIAHPSKETMLLAARISGYSLRFLPATAEPDEEVFQAAVSKNPNSIRYVDNPSHKVVEIALYGEPMVTVNHLLQKDIPVPMDLLNEAFKSKRLHDYQIIETITTLCNHTVNIPVHVLMTALQVKTYFIGPIIDLYGPPSAALQLAASHIDEHGKTSIRHAYQTAIIMLDDKDLVPIDQVLIDAMLYDESIFSDLLKKGILPSTGVILRAIELDGENLGILSRFLNNHNVSHHGNIDEISNLIDDAVRKNVKFIKFVKNPSDDLQQYVVDADPKLIVYIEHPTANSLMKAAEHDVKLLDKIKTTDPNTQVLVDFIRSHHS
jgi:hypothetical protein